MPPPADPDAVLDALWREHAAAVVRYARRRVLPAEVDEVVAETFLVAWRRLDDVPAYALPWLLGVARGVSANVRRSARRHDALTDRLGTDRAIAQDSAHDAFMSLGEPLERALDALRPDDRELLTLLAWDGLSREQTAIALGISRGTLAVRLHRVRGRVRDLLDEPDIETGPRARRAPQSSTPTTPDLLRSDQS